MTPPDLTARPFDFDAHIPRRGTGSIKWEFYAQDVLPLWVADADFTSPPAVIDALQARIAHGVFGYQMDAPALRDVLVNRLATRHAMTVEPGQIVFLPGLGAALNVFARTFGAAGCGVMINTPIYPPFMKAISNAKKDMQAVPLAVTLEDGLLHYTMDFDAMEAAITPHTRLFMLCNPHNPVGRAFSRAELERLADFVTRHDLIVCADEIHCDLIMDEATPHISFASLSPEIAGRTITLMAPSKTFNVPGLGLGFAVATDPDLLAQLRYPVENGGLYCGPLGYTGALAAYTGGDDWLADLRVYLRGNRDYTTAFMREYLPGVPVTQPQGTYLSWFDLREAVTGLAEGDETPAAYLVRRAKVGLNDGLMFGEDGAGYVRLNFACPRPTLTEALERIRAALGD